MPIFKTSSKTQGLVPVALISSVSKLRVIRLKIKVLTRVRTERIVFDNMVKGQYIKDVGNFFLLLDPYPPYVCSFNIAMSAIFVQFLTPPP